MHKASLMSQLPDYQFLTTIPGVAMKLPTEAGDPRQFRHHRQFLNFRGVDLATVQSGVFRGQSKASKYRRDVANMA